MSDKESAIVQNRRDEVIEIAKQIYISEIVVTSEVMSDSQLNEIACESFRCASAFVKASELYRNGKK